MSSQADHLAALQALAPTEWGRYLADHSGLPGPRANLELAQAVADAASAAQIAELAASEDEFTALCGAIGLGRLLSADADPQIEAELRMLATDPRWRVREGVAMALQRVGDADRERLWLLAEQWTSAGATAEPDLLLLRAVAAGVAEPRLVKAAPDAQRVVRILERITEALVSIPRPARRGREDVRVLRQALGYAWSVAAVGAPEDGFESLERRAESDDPDARWIARSNAGKARLSRLDPDRTAALARAAATGERAAPSASGQAGRVDSGQPRREVKEGSRVRRM
jgi:hypothetical protein